MYYHEIDVGSRWSQRKVMALPPLQGSGGWRRHGATEALTSRGGGAW